MVSVIVPPTGIAVSGMNCRTGATADPATLEVMVMDVNVRAGGNMGNCIAEPTASVEVVIRRPPKVLAIVKIVKPEQVTVIHPLATDADVVMIMFPLRMSDVEALPSEGLETSHVPVLPMNGK